MNAQKFWLRMVYLGYISVSRSGVITTVTGKRTRGSRTRNGYLVWTAWDKWSQTNRSVYLHRLVWLVFKGRIPKGMEVNHIDNDRTNNSIDNLELVTSQGNSDHAVAQGRMPKGEQSVRAKLTDAEVRALRKEWCSVQGRTSQQAFARSKARPGVSHHTIVSALRGNRYKTA